MRAGVLSVPDAVSRTRGQSGDPGARPGGRGRSSLFEWQGLLLNRLRDHRGPTNIRSARSWATTNVSSSRSPSWRGTPRRDRDQGRCGPQRRQCATPCRAPGSVSGRLRGRDRAPRGSARVPAGRSAARRPDLDAVELIAADRAIASAVRGPSSAAPACRGMPSDRRRSLMSRTTPSPGSRDSAKRVGVGTTRVGVGTCATTRDVRHLYVHHERE